MCIVQSDKCCYLSAFSYVIVGHNIAKSMKLQFVVPFCKELKCRYIFIDPSRCSYVCRRF